MEHVFAYGILRADRPIPDPWASLIVERYPLEWLPVPGYLVQLGRCPALLWRPNQPHRVLGTELVVRSLGPFDRAGQYPVLWSRTRIVTPRGDAWVYYYPYPTGDAPRILSGNAWPTKENTHDAP